MAADKREISFPLRWCTSIREASERKRGNLLVVPNRILPLLPLLPFLLTAPLADEDKAPFVDEMAAAEDDDDEAAGADARGLIGVSLCCCCCCICCCCCAMASRLAGSIQLCGSTSCGATKN